jgi:hypothetical protein
MEGLETRFHMRAVAEELRAICYATFLLSLLFSLQDGAICSSESSVNFQRTARCHVPEGRNATNNITAGTT